MTVRNRLAAILFVPLLLAAPARATMVNVGGQGLWMPSVTVQMPLQEDGVSNNAGSLTSANGASAATATCGNVFQAGGFAGTKNLQNVYFKSGNVTAGTSAVVQMSIQGMATAAGPPWQPDGTIKGSSNNASSTLATSSIAGASWITGFPNFTSPAVVHFGDTICIVWGWNTVGSGATVQFGYGTQGDWGNLNGYVTTTNGSTYTVSPNPLFITLVFDDGTYGTLDATFGPVNVSGATFNNASNPEEYGMAFQLPFNATIDALGMSFQFATGATTATLELTDGTTQLASVSIIGAQINSTGGSRNLASYTIAPLSLTRNKQYYLGLKATSSGNVTANYNVVAQSYILGQWPAGGNFTYSTAHSGTWAAPTVTRRLFAAIRISQIDDGTGSGGGSPRGVLGGERKPDVPASFAANDNGVVPKQATGR